MSDLMARIDGELANGPWDATTERLLIACKAEIERLEAELAKAKEYVPMTDDELEEIFFGVDEQVNALVGVKNVQQEIIQRASLTVKEKE